MDNNRPFCTLLPELILASQSPGRRELLRSLGCLVHVVPTYSDEDHDGTVGSDVVQHLAERKLHAYSDTYGYGSLPVLCADTLIGCDGTLIGKAENLDQARAHIMLLQGRSHAVYSGFALFLPESDHASARIVSGSDEATVTFKSMDASQIERYLAQGDWRGAAGSYRLQGAAASVIQHITGDRYTVVGLPIQAISAILSSPDCL